jgi:uncharacterized protein (DUF2141 family)
MNPPVIRRFWVATIEELRMRLVTKFRSLVRRAIPASVILPALAFSQSNCPGIHVKILNIRNSTGTVACALFESSEGFPGEYLRMATNVMVIKIRKDQARCDFEDIPPGTYAMAVVHDENMNGKLDMNRLGIPTEGYGFSKDARGLLGAPSFDAASFPYNGQNLDLTMTLRY